MLAEYDIKAHTYPGVRQMFGLHIVKTGIISGNPGKFCSDISDRRHAGDYDDLVEFTKEDVLDVIGTAGKLISKIENLLKWLLSLTLPNFTSKYKTSPAIRRPEQYTG